MVCGGSELSIKTVQDKNYEVTDSHYFETYSTFIQFLSFQPLCG
jgi:hypothetical protein